MAATLFHFPASHLHSPHKLFFSRCAQIIPHSCSVRGRAAAQDSDSGSKYIQILPRESAKGISDVDLYNGIKEVLSSVGLPEDHVPTYMELSQYGRKDLAKVVRRRGYKYLRELLSTSQQSTYESLDSCSEILSERRSGQLEGSVARQNIVETESTNPHKDLVLSTGHGAEIFNGKSMPSSTQHVDASGESFLSRIGSQKEESQAEIFSLKFELHQKELELTRLKQQIEEEKRLLSNLQSKGKRETSKAQRLISGKDAEIYAAEESLSGPKEVEIECWQDGESVEVVGIFNGVRHKVKWIYKHPQGS